MPPSKQYAANQRLLKLDPEAAALLDKLAPSTGRRGRYVSNLILMEAARREERQKLTARVQAALAGQDDGNGDDDAAA